MTAALIVFAGVVGGGVGGMGDAACQLFAIALAGTTFVAIWLRQARVRAPRWVCLLPALAVALPLLQLIPIPVGLWRMGPARSELAAQLKQAGIEPVHLISLNPAATEAALWFLLPGVASFLAALVLPVSRRRWLLAPIMLVVVANVLLGMAQLGDGVDSELRLYANTNRDQAVGFFANRNHMAGLLAMTMPLSIIITTWGMAKRAISPLWIFTGGGLVVLSIVGVALTHSRAGVLLGMLAVLGGVPLALAAGRSKGARRLLILTLGISLVLAIQFALVGLLGRTHDDPVEDGRWEYARVTAAAAADYLPLGSGLGTFRLAYQPFEARATPTNKIVNHAHNDFIELWLEGGFAAAILIALVLAAWMVRGLQLFRLAADDVEAGEFLLARSCWMASVLCLLHSALDYPLRHTATLVAFAALSGIAFARIGNERQNAAGHGRFTD